MRAVAVTDLVTGAPVSDANVYTVAAGVRSFVAVTNAQGVAAGLPDADLVVSRVGYSPESVPLSMGAAPAVEMVPDTLPDLTVTPELVESGAAWGLLALLAAVVILDQ